MICESILIAISIASTSARVSGVHRNVMAWFQEFAWPGNVRQLRNLLERAVIIAGEGFIASRHLPPEYRSQTAGRADAEEIREFPVAAPAAAAVPQNGGTPPEADDSVTLRVGVPIEDLKQAYIKLVMKRTKGNRTKAAEILGISLRTLHNWLREAAIEDVKSASSCG